MKQFAFNVNKFKKYHYKAEYSFMYFSLIMVFVGIGLLVFGAICNVDIALELGLIATCMFLVFSVVVLASIDNYKRTKRNYFLCIDEENLKIDDNYIIEKIDSYKLTNRNIILNGKFRINIIRDVHYGDIINTLKIPRELDDEQELLKTIDNLISIISNRNIISNHLKLNLNIKKYQIMIYPIIILFVFIIILLIWLIINFNIVLIILISLLLISEPYFIIQYLKYKRFEDDIIVINENDIIYEHKILESKGYADDTITLEPSTYIIKQYCINDIEKIEDNKSFIVKGNIVLKKYRECGPNLKLISTKEINKVKIPKIFENQDYLFQSLTKLKKY